MTVEKIVAKAERNLYFAEKREDWDSVCKIVRRVMIDLRKNGVTSDEVIAPFRRAAENALWAEDRERFEAAWREHAEAQQAKHDLAVSA
jgi:hypothetical protein